jgi:hypothetical protein
MKKKRKEKKRKEKKRKEKKRKDSCIGVGEELAGKGHIEESLLHRRQRNKETSRSAL